MDYKIYEEKEGQCTCLECGVAIAGRKDKKFCSLSCKNSYNNRRLQIQRKYRSGILASISKNYEILEMLIREKTSHAGLEELKAMGFESSCCTGQKSEGSKHVEYNCFDICYSKSNTRIFNIKREDITRCSTVPFQDPNSHR